MTPFEFTLENAVEIVPDARRKLLEGEARKFAGAGLRIRRHWREARTLWDYVVVEHERLVWRSAYAKRRARMERMKNV